MNAPIPNQFDPANARELCALSAEAYQRPATAEEADTHVLLDRREQDLIIAFRGTADLRNWLTDLDCELIRVGDFRVHRGFHEAVQAVELDLDSRLGGKDETRLWVTGHSLGGALAKLFALRAAERGHPVAGVYTFGQPRVGDAAFAHRYDSVLKPQTFRVVHADDIVPRVPWLLGRYRHAGHEVFFPAPVSAFSLQPLAFQQDLPWPRKLFYEIPGLLREATQHKLALLDDHHVSRYLALFPGPRKTVRVSYSCRS